MNKFLSILCVFLLAACDDGNKQVAQPSFKQNIDAAQDAVKDLEKAQKDALQTIEGTKKQNKQ